MKYRFQKFNDSYYEDVREFLIDLSKERRSHINWNWARWEWMYFHPDFDNSLSDKIGLWFCGEEVVGIAIYDHYLGEAFFAAKKGFEELKKVIIDYMIENFSDENGLGIAVNDTDNETVDLILSCGFSACDQAENVLELLLDDMDFDTNTADNIQLHSIDIKEDLYKHHKLLWKGFDHEGEPPMDEKTLEKQRRMMSAPHLNSQLHIVAENEDSEYVAYCGLWYDEKTDYVYVEPVCTVPEYRNKGLAKAVLKEALKRAYDMGAKKAYVISDIDFYKRTGFSQHSHYTFYWHKQNNINIQNGIQGKVT